MAVRRSGWSACCACTCCNIGSICPTRPAEEALYESLSMRRFVGVDLGREPVPDETTILNFRRLLEQHALGKPLFERINQHLAARGMKVAGGTIVDATIIAAPSSTKNQARARDPEMHQTRNSLPRRRPGASSGISA